MMATPNDSARWYAFWRDHRRQEYRALRRTLRKLTDPHSGCDLMRAQMLACTYGQRDDRDRLQWILNLNKRWVRDQFMGGGES